MTAIRATPWVPLVQRTAAYGATSPFVQASLNDRLPHAYLQLVRRGKVLELLTQSSL